MPVPAIVAAAAPVATRAGMHALSLFGVATIVTLEFKALEAFADWRMRRQQQKLLAAQQPKTAKPAAQPAATTA
jgi:hypothetical protein